MYKAIIFDCFGVLATDGWLPFKETYFKGQPELWDRASDLNKQADAGLISTQDFVEAIATLAKLSPAAVKSEIRHNMPNPSLFEYIRELKPNYKIGLLSNASTNFLDDIFTPEQLSLIDEVVLSYETGHVKPSLEAYLTVSDSLGLDPKECIFIDDQERFVTAAKDSGMAGIYYKDNDQLKTDLGALLQDNSTNPKS